MAKSELEIVISAKDETKGAIGGITTSLGSLGKLAGGLALTGIGLAAREAAAGGVAALGAGINYAVQQAMTAQEVNAQFEQVLKNIGEQAPITSDAANDLAEAIMNVTRFDDEAVLSAEGVLLKFTSIGKNVFPEATRATADLAQTMGMDMSSAAQMLGRALEDPARGLGTLRRAGIVFTTEQENMIKSMVEAGQTEQAQIFLLDQLKARIGGTAQAAGQTLGGQMDILRNKLDNVAETAGSVLLPAFSEAITTLQPYIMDLANTLAAFVQSDEFKVWIEKIVGWLKNDLPTAITTVSQFWTTQLKPALISVQEVLQKVGDFLGVVMPPLLTAFKVGWEIQIGVFKLVFDAVKSVVDSFKWLWDKIKEVKDALANLTLPDWLTPGSPTPLELGLLGINKAMKQLSTTGLPTMQASLSLGSVPALAPMTVSGSANYGGGGGSVTLVYSPTFSTASSEELQYKLQPFIQEGIRRSRR